MSSREPLSRLRDIKTLSVFNERVNKELTTQAVSSLAVMVYAIRITDDIL